MARTFKAKYLKRKDWWIGWSDDLPGALTQGRTLSAVKANLRDAVRLMLQPVDLDGLPSVRVVEERIRL